MKAKKGQKSLDLNAIFAKQSVDPKNVMFNVRVPQEVYESFVRVCKSQSVSASEVVRRFMAETIEKYSEETDGT